MALYSRAPLPRHASMPPSPRSHRRRRRPQCREQSSRGNFAIIPRRLIPRDGPFWRPSLSLQGRTITPLAVSSTRTPAENDRVATATPRRTGYLRREKDDSSPVCWVRPTDSPPPWSSRPPASLAALPDPLSDGSLRAWPLNFNPPSPLLPLPLLCSPLTPIVLYLPN